jgi:uncharacterized membrane-anchored protein
MSILDGCPGGRWVRIVAMACCLAFAVGSSAQEAPSAEEVIEAAPPVLSPQQEAARQKLMSVTWSDGPVEGTLHDRAKIQIPEGYMFADAKGAQAMLEAYGNPPDPSVVGAIQPKAADQNWFLVFSFDDIGYVKDDDKDSIDAGAILSGMKEGLEASNEYRRSQGASEISDLTWHKEPFYDPSTNNLTWGLALHSPEGMTVNYDIRLLGRRGVMRATLVSDPSEMDAAVPVVSNLLTKYEFISGEKYAEWKAGDKIAAYGLTGLVAGGAIAVAAKSGLLAKLGILIAKMGKFAIVAVLGVVALIARVFTGRKSSDPTPS